MDKLLENWDSRGTNIAIAAGSVTIAALLGYVLTRKQDTAPPGPPSWPLVGCLPAAYPYLKELRSHDFFYDVFQKYGRVVQLNFGTKVILVSDPVEIRKILTESDSFGRDESLNSASVGIMQGALFALPSGEVWKRHRKLLQPAFGPSHLRYTAQVALEKSNMLVQLWKAKLGNKVSMVTNVMEATRAITMDLIGLVGFGSDLGNLQQLYQSTTQKSAQISVQDLEHLCESLQTRLFNPSWLWYLYGVGASDPKIQSLSKKMDDLVHQLATERKQQTASQIVAPDAWDKNILDRLLFSKSEEGDAFTAEEITQELKAFFFAGHETTSNTLGWILYVLSNDPGVLKKLQKEVDDLYGKMGSLEGVNLNEVVPKLTYLDHVVRETLRLYPVAGRTARTSKKQVEVGGYTFEKGTTFLASFYNVHRDNSQWKDALSFRPERWDHVTATNPPYLPFGAGPMMCIGFKMALLETKIILMTLVRHFDFRLAPGFVAEPVSTLTFGLKKGLLLTVIPRAV
ncbi:hypothetical protein HDU91_006369 [Kappamyces sp. JEL0680]|nr:hypothetical protein HDU91_006369 [Kappamyces sp. JEL0680]